MTTSMARVIVWAPRVLGILYILFLSMFALDVFGEQLSVGQTMIALAMHLIPSAVMIAAVAIAWRWPAIGGLIFIAAGLVYSLTMGLHHPSWIAIIAGPVFVIGALFLSGRALRDPQRAGV